MGRDSTIFFYKIKRAGRLDRPPIVEGEAVRRVERKIIYDREGFEKKIAHFDRHVASGPLGVGDGDGTVFLQDLFEDQRQQFAGFALALVDTYQSILFVDAHENWRGEGDDKQGDRFYANAFAKRGLKTAENSLIA